ncbi:MAG: hypothetical protein MK101_01555 [Phycisphaerales bacterium]|nr:hypothetical protein [Phycisphaerales bacterium]
MSMFPGFPQGFAQQQQQQPQQPQVQVDDSALVHSYVNAANVTPMADDCSIDMGTTSVAVPPDLAGQQIGPENAARLAVLFRHTHRIQMTWPTAKRIALLLGGMVQSYEAVAGEIDLEADQKIAQAMQAMAQAQEGADIEPKPTPEATTTD